MGSKSCDAVVERWYQSYIYASKEIIPLAQKFIAENFVQSDFDGNHFKFKYKKRYYEGELVQNANVEETRGSPKEIDKGTIEIRLLFPSKNKSNKRVVKKFKKLEFPFHSIDYC